MEDQNQPPQPQQQPTSEPPASPLASGTRPAMQDVVDVPQGPDAPITDSEMAAEVTSDRIIALFSYLSILFVVPMFMRPNNAFCKYHARQGMVLFFGWFAVHMLGMIIRFLPFGAFKMLAVAIFSFNGLALFGLIAYGAFNVWHGNMKPLPVIGMLVDKFFAPKTA